MSLSILTMLLLVKKEQRNQVLQRVLPLAIPGPPGTQLAFAAITAEQDLRREAAAEQKLVTEAIQAAGIKNETDLAAFPALSTAFKKLPAGVKANILNVAPIGSGTVTPPPIADREIALATNPDPTAAGGARARSGGQPPTVRTP